MAQEGSEGVPVPFTNKPDLVKEPGIEEIQKEIVSTILERLKDSRAINLVYPNEPSSSIHYGGADPDYEHGSQRRFLVLDKSPLLGTDQICIAATDNKSIENSITQGAGLLQSGRGTHSEREITLTRFVQTAKERLKNEGIYYLIVLSENLKDVTGTLSVKGQAYPHSRYHTFDKNRVAPFVERWSNGDFQLANTFIYDTSGKDLDFQEADYREILKALKTAKVNLGMTKKVAQHEQEFDLVKIVSS